LPGRPPGCSAPPLRDAESGRRVERGKRKGQLVCERWSKHRPLAPVIPPGMARWRQRYTALAARALPHFLAQWTALSSGIAIPFRFTCLYPRPLPAFASQRWRAQRHSQRVRLQVKRPCTSAIRDGLPVAGSARLSRVARPLVPRTAPRTRPAQYMAA
jgi:hypothetical protein